MGYINDMYGNRGRDFIKGFIAAMDTYSVWRNGIREIGSPEKEVQEEMRHAIIELGGDPQEFEDEGLI
jgi:flagellar biosynthesis regulator FlaF